MPDQSTQSEQSLSQDEQLLKQLQKKLDEPLPPAPGPLPDSGSSRAAAKARRSLAARKAAQKRKRPAVVAPKHEEPLAAEPAAAPEFEVEGFGVFWVEFLELVLDALRKQSMEPDKRARLIETADKYANARIPSIAWLAEFMPEIALFGATLAIIVEAPSRGISHPVDPGNPGNGQDDTREGVDEAGKLVDSVRSPEPGVS